MTVEELRSLWQRETPKGNRKVRNATRNERGGVVFASKIERFMYDLLTMHGIGFEFQKRYVLQEGFQYNGQTVRPVTYTTDFWLPDHDMVIDTKGQKTQQGTLRIKMLKRQFAADILRIVSTLLKSIRAEANTLAATIIRQNVTAKNLQITMGLFGRPKCPTVAQS